MEGIKFTKKSSLQTSSTYFTEIQTEKDAVFIECTATGSILDIRKHFEDFAGSKSQCLSEKEEEIEDRNKLLSKQNYKNI